MKQITTNDELEIGKNYWCKPKRSTYSKAVILTVGEHSQNKFIGSHIWCTENNNQGLEKYTIIGPIEEPDWSEYD